MIEQQLRTAMLADSAISALTTGIYPQTLPQGVSKPCITYMFNNGIQPLISGGRHAISTYSVTLHLFAETYGSGRDLTRAVLDYIQGLNTVLTTDTVVSASVQNVFTDYEETLELYSATIDFILHAQEA